MEDVALLQDTLGISSTLTSNQSPSTSSQQQLQENDPNQELTPEEYERILNGNFYALSPQEQEIRKKLQAKEKKKRYRLKKKVMHTLY